MAEPNSIAGLTVEGDADDNLIRLFAQWGLEQLLLAVVVWVAILRHRFLVPFVLLLQLIDWFMRGVMGEVKPLIVDSMSPGGVGNIVLGPAVAIALWFSLPRLGERADHPRIETTRSRRPSLTNAVSPSRLDEGLGSV
ncbi:MAG: hypothetical protein OEQ47_04015 [Acidimicrobiia bacterium]|nr:hypothetical protein [Acidimicrobiia bacterium]